MQEIWKDIKEYEGIYQVSNLGRIKSLKFGSEKILKQKESKGYLCVVLCKKGIRKDMRSHRLVAEAFICNDKNLPQVNHIDEIKTNNNYKNLEWVTASQNINHGERNRKVAEKKGKPIIQYLNGVEIARFKTIMEAERRLGFSNSYISACCLGKYKSAYGYQWRFI